MYQNEQPQIFPAKRALISVSFSLFLLTGCLSDCPKQSFFGLSCQSTIPPAEKSSEKDEYPEYNNAVSTVDVPLTLRRLSDNDAASDDLPLRHHYSKRQAWNSDESLIDLGEKIVSQEFLEPLLDYVPLSSERNWSNISPNLMYGIRYNPEPNELAKFDFNTENYETIFKFDAYTNCTLGQHEGSLSYNDKLVLVACENVESKQKKLFSIDIESKKIIGELIAEDNFNWASFSYTGKYIILENNTYPDPAPELIRYSASLETPITLNLDPQHGDMSLDADGHDVYVMIRSRVVSYVRLADRLTVNLDIGGAINALSHGHISCRNYRRPGWCYISSGKHGHLGAVSLGKAFPLRQELIALDAKPKTAKTAYEHWGFHRSSNSSYAASAKATVSPSGEKILFTSDWFGEQEINEFILEVSEPVPNVKLAEEKL